MGDVETLGLVTFNLYNHPDSWPRRAPLVVHGLAGILPDVVALQEVGIPDRQTAPIRAALEERAGMPYAVAGCEMHRTDGWSEGIAVLSRHPITASDALAVEDEGNICLWTRLDTPGGALDLYAVHLHPRLAGLRERQIAAVIAWAGGHTGATCRIVCGDFNARPDERTIALLTEAGFVEAYVARHGRNPERTFPTRLRADIYDRYPAACLDYIFIQQDGGPVVADCRLVLGDPDPADPALYPSDHIGVLAQLHPSAQP